MRIAGLAPFVAFLRRTGTAPERLLARASLPLFVLDSPEALIPLCQVLRFMENAAHARGQENLGLLAGQETPIEALGMFGRLIRRSRTLRDALHAAMSAMSAFDSGGRYRLTREGDRLRLHHTFVDGLEGGSRQADQYWSMLSLNVLRLVAEPRWRPGEVRLQPSEAGVAVTFPATLLGRPLARTCDVRRAEDQDVEAWTASAPADDFPGSVLQVIVTLSSPEFPRIALTADAIGMSVRALQRRLAEDRLSYENLVAHARFATAMHLLEHTDAKVLDIALDVGYSDHAHFTRAFRRWTGVAPREFRRLHRTELGAPAPASAASGGDTAALVRRVS